jgi:hypothetical protein
LVININHLLRSLVATNSKQAKQVSATTISLALESASMPPKAASTSTSLSDREMELLRNYHRCIESKPQVRTSCLPSNRT